MRLPKVIITLLVIICLLTGYYFYKSGQEVYGTDEPFASEAIYFIMTDRFVDGDKTNNHINQGGNNPTWKREIKSKKGESAYLGYMGGDFKGIYENADYIKDLGFTAVWISPIVDNPDEAFTGGEKAEFGPKILTDGGKAGYHGYWGVNFYKTDEHLESEGFSFPDFTSKMQQDYGLKIVLDIVCNHGSPASTMLEDKPGFGEIFDGKGNLVADHQNLPPSLLNPEQNPLHRFYNKKTDIAQLSDLNHNRPEVLKYLTDAYLERITQGAAAFRIDTIGLMPHSFWKKFSDRVREKHPEFFMFGENFNYDPNVISQHQKAQNGGISVLDFPASQCIKKVFENPDSDYSEILEYLHLSDNTYTNPYELVTFYDNHDMARMKADENGFIDAHNWLFTSRDIPCVYYGSESAFQAGRAEHMGNRNYFGAENIELARKGKIYKNLAKIANLRKNSPALQRGKQINMLFEGNKAAFYRIYRKNGINQTALVLLNKGELPERFKVKNIVTGKGFINETIEPHGVKVIFFEENNY